MHFAIPPCSRFYALSQWEKFFDPRRDDRTIFRLSSAKRRRNEGENRKIFRKFSENRRRNEGDFKTFIFRSAADPPATIEQFFDCRRRNEGENRKIFRKSKAEWRRKSNNCSIVAVGPPSFRRRQELKMWKIFEPYGSQLFCLQICPGRDSNHLPRNHSLT